MPAGTAYGCTQSDLKPNAVAGERHPETSVRQFEELWSVKERRLKTHRMVAVFNVVGSNLFAGTVQVY